MLLSVPSHIQYQLPAVYSAIWASTWWPCQCQPFECLWQLFAPGILSWHSVLIKRICCCLQRSLQGLPGMQGSVVTSTIQTYPYTKCVLCLAAVIAMQYLACCCSIAACLSGELEPRLLLSSGLPLTAKSFKIKKPAFLQHHTTSVVLTCLKVV